MADIRTALATLVLRWDGDDLDWESERRAMIEVTNGVGELTLPRGDQGDKGDDGAPGPGLAPDQVTEYATDELAIANLPGTFGAADRGFCSLNNPTKTAFFWSGTAWLAVQDAVGMQGPTGSTVSLGIGTVTTGPSGGTASVTLDPSSTETNKVWNITLPRGLQGVAGVGIQGIPGDALLSANDVDHTNPPENGQVLVWDETLEKAKFSAPIGGSVGPYTIGPNDPALIAVNDSSWPQEYKQVGRIDVPAQAFSWHPRVEGYMDVKVSGSIARVDLEARLSSVTGPLVGRGPGAGLPSELDQYTPRQLGVSFEATMTPESLGAYVAKGQAASLYFSIRRIDTLTTFGVATRKDRAGFAVYCDPIPGSA